MPYFIQPNLVQEKFNYVQYIEKNGGKICRTSTFFVSTDQNSALSLVAPCSVCQEKLKFVIVDSSTRRSNSVIICRILVQFPKQARSHGVSFQLGASLFSSEKENKPQHPKKVFLR